jgi:hypothetical protein
VWSRIGRSYSHTEISLSPKHTPGLQEKSVRTFMEGMRPTLDSYVSACIVELTGRDTKIVNTLEDKVSGPRSTEVA